MKDGGEWFIKFHGVFMGGLNDGEGGGWRRRDEEYINFSEISLVSGFVSQSSGGLHLHRTSRSETAPAEWARDYLMKVVELEV